MSTCRESIHRLLDLLEGDCSPEIERELRQHLAGCHPCEEFLESYKKVPELCKKALVEKMPDEVAEKLKDFLRAKAGVKSGGKC